MQKNVISYLIGQSKRSNLSIIDYHTVTNSNISLQEKDETVKIQLPLQGLHNLYNAVLAYSVAGHLPIERERIILELKQFPGVPGRFETYKDEEGKTIVIDYAHTADSFFIPCKRQKSVGQKESFIFLDFEAAVIKRKEKKWLKFLQSLAMS